MRNRNPEILGFAWVWTFFVLHGLKMAFLLPLWGGFDEWLHLSYIHYLNREHRIPLLSVPSVPEEVRRSASLMPHDAYAMGQPSFAEFWRKAPEDRTKILQEIHGLSLRPDSPYVFASWQAQHPPLYYALMRPFLNMSEGMSLTSSVRRLRVLSVLIASLALFPIYRMARRFLSVSAALGILIFVAAYPSTFVLLGHVTNDTLTFVLLNGAILAILISREKSERIGLSLLVGLLIGAASATKLYGLILLPVALGIGVTSAGAGRSHWRERVRNAAGILLGFAFTFLPWVLFCLRHYGTWNPTVHSALTKDFSWIEKLRAVSEVDWKSFALSNAIGILWAGNWSFVTFPSWTYKLNAFLWAAAAGSTLFLWVRGRRPRRESGVLIAASILFFLALAQHQLHIRLAGNSDPTGCWYWAVLLPSQAILFFGIAAPPIKVLTWQITASTAAYATTLAAAWGLMVPYYSGFLERGAGILWRYPIGEALGRLAALNQLPAGTFLVLQGAEIAAFAFALHFLRNPDPQPL